MCSLLNNLEENGGKNRIQSSVNDVLGTVGEVTAMKREVNTAKNTTFFKKYEGAAPRPSWF